MQTSLAQALPRAAAVTVWLASSAAAGAPATDDLAGRWRAVHTAHGYAVRHLIRVTRSGSGYSARGLAWFGLTEKQALLAAKGSPPRGVNTPGAMAVVQLFAVSLKDGSLTFRGRSARYVFGKRATYAPDTFTGEIKPPGLLAGESTDSAGTKAPFRLWKDGALAKPMPLELAKGKVHRVACLDDEQHHYTCYIPKGYDPAAPTPVLVNCSPGGNAKPLSTATADELGWLMVGLTESRNGPIQPSVANRDAVLFDLRRRFRLHPRRLYFSGFSGGARMASWSGVAYPEWCAGMICIGAGFLQTPPPIHQPVSFIVGQSDMNHGEVTRLSPAEQKKGRKTKLIIHPGGHSWGRKEDHEAAIRWLDGLYRGDAKPAKAKDKQ